MKIALALLAALTIAEPAAAECKSPAAIALMVFEKNPTALVTLIPAGLVTEFLAAFNSTPPATTYTADQVMIVTPSLDGSHGVDVVLFTAGCNTVGGFVSNEIYNRVMNEIAKHNG